MAEDPAADSTAHRITWGQDRRLQFIDFRLRWEGKLNRTDLTDYFGLSIPQASIDISKYTEIAPANLIYDRSSRTYVATPSFKSQFPRSSAQRYLAELFAIAAGILEPSATYIGTKPEVELSATPERSVDEVTLALLVQAIRDRLAVDIEYQSMASPDPSSRVISPHALGSDGFRWHVRAYCHAKKGFRDFVIARMLRVSVTGPSDVEPSSDAQWRNILSLVLVPHPGLSLGAKRAIELDYGMVDGQVELKCRQALLFYTLRRLGLHRSSNQPAEQQIDLKNRDELEPYIASVSNTRQG